MKVLLLSPTPERLTPILAASGDQVAVQTERLDAEGLAASGAEFVVSFGFRHILRQPVLDALPGRVVNLHISALPWNRGSDPNFWSFLEGTPKGVSLHHVDAGVDTGDLIAQRVVEFGEGGTLASTYARLQDEMVALFAATWPALRRGEAERRPQPPGGTLHRQKDKEPFLHLLAARGWDTPVAEIEAHGRARGLFKCPERDVE